MDNKPNVLVAPSILAADFSHLEQEIRRVERGGADLLHLDVMDAHFVPNLTFGPMIIEAINRLTDLHLSTHLMISEPHRYLKEFVEAGSDAVIVHIECYEDPRPVLREIRDLGALAGLTLNPDTPFEAVAPYMGDIDLFLVMSVNPGWGGQKFIPDVLSKATRAAELKRDRGHTYAIHIDGGIDLDTAPRAVQAGAETLIAGSAIFRAQDPEATVGRLRDVAVEALG